MKFGGLYTVTVCYNFTVIDVLMDVENGELRTGYAEIPGKSKRRYENVYNTLMKWLGEKNGQINEENLLAYFVLRSEALKSAGSLWAEFSMLKTMIKLNNNINISKFSKLVAFIKKKILDTVVKNPTLFPGRI